MMRNRVLGNSRLASGPLSQEFLFVLDLHTSYNEINKETEFACFHGIIRRHCGTITDTQRTH